MNMTKPLFVLSVSSAFLGGVALVMIFVSVYFLDPCPTEDSTNCMWNASERGNGLGDSFIDINGSLIYFK